MMKSRLYINIHTHLPAKDGEWALLNFHQGFMSAIAPAFSAGLHPLFIDEKNWKTDLKALASISDNSCWLAVGECGLDRICDTDFTLQEKVFTAQVQLANEIGKPLIIHCVRAHEQVLTILNKTNNKVPVIFHGYNKSLPLAQKIISKGYFLSFGHTLEKVHMQQIFLELPPESIFLETDGKEIAIEKVYELAAGGLNISIDELHEQLNQNLKKVFNLAV